MVIVGVDVGVSNIKVVLFNSNQVKSQILIPVGEESIIKTVDEALKEVVSQANLAPEALQRVLATGSGASILSYPRRSDVACLAKGSYFVKMLFCA